MQGLKFIRLVFTVYLCALLNGAKTSVFIRCIFLCSHSVPGKDNPYHCFFAVTVFLLFFALSSYCFKLLSHKLLEQVMDIYLFAYPYSAAAC